MKNIYIFIAVFVVSLLSLSPAADAQIRYDGTYFLMGGAPKNDKYKFNIAGYNGLFIKKDNCLFKIDLTGKTPALAGSGDRINFYNPSEEMYATLMSAGYHVTVDPSCDGFHFFSPLDEIPNKLSRINAVSFDWKSAAKESGSISDIGMLAQEIEAVFPELVTTDERGVKLVNYIGLIPLLTQTIQELNARIETQKETIDNLLKQLENEN